MDRLVVGVCMRSETRSTLSADRLDAVIFDLDGVITDTAPVHAAAWKRLFDEFLEARARTTSEKVKPYEHADYLRHIDGKPRFSARR